MEELCKLNPSLNRFVSESLTVAEPMVNEWQNGCYRKNYPYGLSRICKKYEKIEYSQKLSCDWNNQDVREIIGFMIQSESET